MNKDRNSKSKYLRAILTAALIAAMMAALSGCTTYNSFRQTFITKPDPITEPTVTIGVIEPQTGRYADKGKAELKGIELANSIYNNVDGQKVQLVKVDTQSSVSATKTAIQGLIEMKPVAIIGAAGDASSLAITEYVDEAGIPAITPSATNPLITQGSNFYFRACLTESQMGEGLAEYACREHGSDHIAIISVKNDTSVSAMLDGFRDKVKAINGKKSKSIVASEEIAPAEEEMEKALRKIRRAGADVCFVSMGAEEMDRFFTIAEKLHMNGVTYLGTRNWGSEDFVNMMKKHSEIKVVFPYESVLSKTDDTSNTITEEAQRFQIEYANRYGDEDIPTDNAALGYDSYLLLINAIHNAKSVEGKDIAAAMREFNGLKCATGLFSFDGTGNVVRAVTLSTIKDGKPVTEYVTRTEAEAKKLEDIDSATATGEESNSGVRTIMNTGEEDDTETVEDGSDESEE